MLLSSISRYFYPIYYQVVDRFVIKSLSNLCIFHKQSFSHKNPPELDFVIVFGGVKKFSEIFILPSESFYLKSHQYVRNGGKDRYTAEAPRGWRPQVFG